MFSEKHPEDKKIEDFNHRYELIRLPSVQTIEIDLGCGTGSFTAQLAQKFPGRTVFGADVMIGRLRKLVKKGERLQLDNLHIWRAEARYLIALMLPDNSIDRIHLLCPDPWPKDKHRGHRLITSDFTAQLNRVLKPGGIFHFSSDDVPYFDSVANIFSQCELFEQAPPETTAEVADIKSDFELRWLSRDKPVRHMHFEKK